MEQIRLANLNDLSAITDIYNSTIAGRKVTADTELVTVEDRLDWYHAHNNTRRPLWVLEDENREICGWASLQNFYGRIAYDGTAEISIYIKESHRGKGFGRYLLHYIISQCHQLKVHTLLGFVFGHNNESMKLFHNAGFKEWGHLPGVAVMDDKRYDLKILGYKIN